VVTRAEARTSVDLKVVHRVDLRVVRKVDLKADLNVKAVPKAVPKVVLSVDLKVWADKARAQVETRAVKARVQEWVLRAEVDLQACKVVIRDAVEALVLATLAVAEAKAATREAPLVAVKVVCNPFI